MYTTVTHAYLFFRNANRYVLFRKAIWASIAQIPTPTVHTHTHTNTHTQTHTHTHTNYRDTLWSFPSKGT